MRNRLIVISMLLSLCINVVPTFSATPIKKEDAALFSKKSIYSDVGVQEQIVSKGTDDTGIRQSDDALNRFTAITATKTGNKYTNTWSNYTIELEDQYYNANEIYDFNAEGIKYDFGVYFNDYSRLAVYYTRLSRDLNVVAANFAPGQPVDDVEIAGQIYKHVALDVKYPYGVEKYNYYLRVIDGKLMVIETYHEDGYDKCRDYIEKFAAVK
ncbi:MAG: hypothetical protein J6P02_00140 [Lachnospiraceae bacterium]|nr:hypothetical protein [Lachnospiraceae bacterium]